jgi:hypothetical protein
VAKTPSIRSGKVSPFKTMKLPKISKNEPIIRDGWLEISESSGIIRRGEVTFSLASLLDKCKNLTFPISPFFDYFSNFLTNFRQNTWKEQDR